MIRVSKTKHGNIRINLDIEKLKELYNHLHYGCKEELHSLFYAMDDFLVKEDIDHN